MAACCQMVMSYQILNLVKFTTLFNYKIKTYKYLFLDKNIILYFKFRLALRLLRNLRGHWPLAGPIRLL